MSTKKDTQKPARNSNKGFDAEEKAAMKERAKELKAEARASQDRAAGERDLLAKIAEMPEADRVIAERIHAIVKANAPELLPKTWYGMPSYANKEGKVVFFYQAAAKFGTRYGTLGFNDLANLDDGSLWPVAYGVSEINAAVEEKIGALVRKAIS